MPDTITVNEAKEQIKDIIYACPLVLSKLESLLKDIRKDFKDKHIYYGNGGSRSKSKDRFSFSSESETSFSSESESKDDTEEMTDEEYNEWVLEVYNPFTRSVPFKKYLQVYHANDNMDAFKNSYYKWCGANRRSIDNTELENMWNTYKYNKGESYE